MQENMILQLHGMSLFYASVTPQPFMIAKNLDL